MKTNPLGSMLASMALFLTSGAMGQETYIVIDTGQTHCYDERQEIRLPAANTPYYGQDAQFDGNQPSYTLSADGLTVLDNITGLTWQKSPDINGDGTIDSLDKMTLAQAQARAAILNTANYGGYSDWRLPSIKELYSLITFAGIDPGRVSGSDTSGLTPFIDRTYFDFAYGDTARGDRIIDMQYASSTLYVYKTMLNSPTMFGVNFADGRIKGYSLDMSWQGPGDSKFPVRFVRGAAYGVNDFVDNRDSTITDRATGLMWTKADSGTGMNWSNALAWVQTKNAENHLGHSDWRLPNAKELQSIVDYTRSPDTTSSAAIDPLFTCTVITNEDGKPDYPYYWTGTTHISSDGTGRAAIYISFGRALGYMTLPGVPFIGAWLDVHGAGAQRSDPKIGNPADFPKGRGPQGDAIRINNFVRMVRSANLMFCSLNSLELSARAAESTEPSTRKPELTDPPHEEPKNRFEQSVSTGYASDQGFMANYRINAQGDFWSLANDFAVILDRLAFTLQKRFDATDFLSVAAEAPATLDWTGSSNFEFGYAGRGKINIHNRRDPRDEDPGWSVWAEAAVQANGQDGPSGNIASFAPEYLSSSPNSRYRAGGLAAATYFNEILTPSVGISSFYDLGSAKPTDVIAFASIAHNWGSRERATKLSVSIPVNNTPTMPNSANQELADPTDSTRFILEQGWGHWMGRVEYSTIGSSAMVGYRF